MMSDEEFSELELRASICPRQCRWAKSEYVHWQKLHEAANEARARVSKAYAAMDEIDSNANISREDKRQQRRKVAEDALAAFDASRTLMRAREAARLDASTAVLNALQEAEVGWERAKDKILERAAQTKGAWHTREKLATSW